MPMSRFSGGRNTPSAVRRVGHAADADRAAVDAVQARRCSCSVVVLPQPDGPSSVRNLPRGMLNEMSSTARSLPNHFDQALHLDVAVARRPAGLVVLAAHAVSASRPATRRKMKTQASSTTVCAIDSAEVSVSFS